jgi:hypothetical protein
MLSKHFSPALHHVNILIRLDRVGLDRLERVQVSPFIGLCGLVGSVAGGVIRPVGHRIRTDIIN